MMDGLPQENILGKGENAGNQHFLLFPNVLFSLKDICHCLSHIKNVVCKSFAFRQVKQFVVW